MIIDPFQITKFKTELSIPNVFVPQILRNPETNKIISHNYVITISKVFEQMLPLGYPKTEIFAYGGEVYDNNSKIRESNNIASVPGPTIIATRGMPINIKWVNNLEENYPVVTHLYGGECSSVFEGHSDAWFTAGEEKVGPKFTTTTTQYMNKGPSMNIWYHDNVLDKCRLKMNSGLYGYYIIKDLDNQLDMPGLKLPLSQFDIPLIIKDYTFNEDGSLWYPDINENLELDTYTVPKFYGNTIAVNGKVWPEFYVDRRLYRFRILNSSNARYYNIYLSNDMNFTQIGSDGGYLPKPVNIKKILVAPGERIDVLVNFSECSTGTKIILQNDAQAPYPNGEDDNFNPQTTGVIMQFVVKNMKREETDEIYEELNTIPKLIPNTKNRILILDEKISKVAKSAVVGSIEEWELVNLTSEAQHIHLNLAKFLIKNKQKIDTESYLKDYNNSNEAPLLETYLLEEVIEPLGNEMGWKDTVVIMPNQVLRIVIRFAPQYVCDKEIEPGENLFPFNPEVGPGYTLHYHNGKNEVIVPFVVKN